MKFIALCVCFASTEEKAWQSGFAFEIDALFLAAELRLMQPHIAAFGSGKQVKVCLLF
jgi:hypothetical protein